MKKKNVDLKYFVVLYDYNKQDTRRYNVISNELIERIYNKIKKNEITNKNELKEDLKRYFMAIYWSRCEYEILVSDWPKHRRWN